MKKYLVVALFLIPSLSCAIKPKITAADYTVPVHVRSSLIVTECSGNSFLGAVGCKMKLHLEARINGKTYTLSSYAESDGVVFKPGDYKAKMIRGAFPSEDPDYQADIEIRLSDGVSKFHVIGESE